MSQRHFQRFVKSKVSDTRKTDNLSILHSSSSTDSSLTYKSVQQVQENASTSEINTSNDNILINTFFPPDNNIILPIDIDLNFDENHIMSNKKKTLTTKLSELAAKYNVSHNCMNDILSIFRSEGHDVPKDVRTLLNTPKKYNIISVDPGSYIHLGIDFMFRSILKTYKNCFNNAEVMIELGLNIDGLPIAKASKSVFWPILLSIVNIPCMSKLVIPIGIYYSNKKKPHSIETFLTPFIDELQLILNYGIQIEKIHFCFTLVQVICDAPAKAFILNVKGHNAYFGCNMCTEEGSYEGRMTYLGVNSSLRTDNSFRLKIDDDYHKGFSPLERLPIDMVSTVTLDYMHVVCLGVVKKLIKFWVKGKKPNRIVQINLDDINSSIENVRQYIPSDFVRLPRPLVDFDYWKATEFRTFVLYTGPIVLKGKLKKSLYSHFMLLHCAIRLLISHNTCYLFNDEAKVLLTKFVIDYPIHYGAEFVNYNVHNLIHLPDCVKLHGPLDNFSAFKFENFLQDIKKKLKNSRFPLQEACNRIIEQQNINNSQVIISLDSPPIFKNEIPMQQSVFNPFFTYYKEVKVNSSVFNCNKVKDKYIMLTCNTISEIKQIIKTSDEQLLFNICKFNHISPLYLTPVDSNKTTMFFVNTLNVSESVNINLSDIAFKCFFIKISESKAIAMTLLHSFG